MSWKLFWEPVAWWQHRAANQCPTEPSQWLPLPMTGKSKRLAKKKSRWQDVPMAKKPLLRAILQALQDYLKKRRLNLESEQEIPEQGMLCCFGWTSNWLRIGPNVQEQPCHPVRQRPRGDETDHERNRACRQDSDACLWQEPFASPAYIPASAFSNSWTSFFILLLSPWLCRR